MIPCLMEKNKDEQQLIQLFFSARNIPGDLDLQIEMIFCKQNKNDWKSNTRETKFSIWEKTRKNNNPDYCASTTYNYIYEKTQDLTITMKDWSGNGNQIGELKTTINEIMCCPNHMLEKPITKNGTFIIKAEIRKQVNEQNPMIFWKWWGKKIKNMDGIFGTSDPFLRFFKLHQSKHWVMIHQTEYLENNENPTWKGCGIPADMLFNDQNLPFKVELWDNEKDENHQYIGGFQTTFNEIMNQKKVTFEAKTQKDKLGGIIGLQTVIWPPIQMKLTVGVDFQKRNNDGFTEDGLHTNHTALQSYYQVLDSLLPFFFQNGFQETIDFYGFGGVPKFLTSQGETVDNCIAVNGNQQYPQVERHKILEIYKEGLKNIQLSKQGCISSIIKKQIEQLFDQNELGIYHVLLLITNGQIGNIEESLCLLPQAAQQPLSIMIMGVGTGNFSSAEKLAHDAKKLKQIPRKVINFKKYDLCAQNFQENLFKKIHNQIVKYAEIPQQEKIRKIQGQK